MPATPRRAQDVALGQIALTQQAQCLRLHQHPARGDRFTLGFGLGAHVHHVRLALGIQMSQLCHVTSTQDRFLSSTHPPEKRPRPDRRVGRGERRRLLNIDSSLSPIRNRVRQIACPAAQEVRRREIGLQRSADVADCVMAPVSSGTHVSAVVPTTNGVCALKICAALYGRIRSTAAA